MEAEAENENPSQPNRCHMDRVEQTNIIEWNKKRKLETDDQLDLPRPKYKCWASTLISSQQGSKSDHHNLEFPSLNSNKLIVKTETYASALNDDISEPKSSGGSNSFGEDSDTAISINEEGKLQIDSAKAYLYDDDIQALINLEEKSLALGICKDHIYSEEEEFEDVFITYGANPNMYILSSGKWNVNQEAESNTRPPTIDQEFEQYFSMLML